MRTNPFNPIYKILNNGESITTSPEMPLLIDIELTNSCNFNCLFCYTGTKAHKRPTGFMSSVLFEKIITEIAPYKIPLRFSRWGEPTLHKNFYDFIKIAKDTDLMCHVNTNGSLLNEENITKLLQYKLDSIKFSFQGTNEKTYSEMRYGKSFSQLVETIKLFNLLREERPYPFIHASTTTTYETPEMISEFKELLSPYCDLVSVGTTNLSHISSEQVNLPEDAKKMLTILKESESIEKIYKACNEVYDKISINWDGTVSACCVDYDNYMTVGDLNTTSIRNIWENSEQLKIYRSLLRDKKHQDLSLCQNCYDTMGLKKNF